jgi:nucleoside-diphosphate-sugar epimerase
MIAAVTGATGFIGQRLLARLLDAGTFSEVRVLTRRARPVERARVFGGDLVTGALEPLLDGANVVFHCAGEVRDEARMRSVHIEGTERLLAAARGRVSRWVQLSSVGAYGQSRRAGVVDEAAPLAPEGEYERTKAQADALVGRESGISTVVVRPSIVFGPGMPNRSLYELIGVVDRGLFFFVGHGAIANYVYVDDVAAALALCGTSPRATGVYNLSDDRPLEQFIGAIARELGRPAPRLRIPEPAARFAALALRRVARTPLTPARVAALTRAVRYSSERIRTHLGFTFSVSIEEGLRRLIREWRAGR